MSENGVEQKYVQEAFNTNWVVPMGPNVNAFEGDLANMANSKSDGSEPLDRKVVCLSAGTAAVHLALIACGVKAGDSSQRMLNAIEPGSVVEYCITSLIPVSRMKKEQP